MSAHFANTLCTNVIIVQNILWIVYKTGNVALFDLKRKFCDAPKMFACPKNA